jgi:hypothetical protein
MNDEACVCATPKFEMIMASLESKIDEADKLLIDINERLLKITREPVSPPQPPSCVKATEPDNNFVARMDSLLNGLDRTLGRLNTVRLWIRELV